MLSQEFVLSLLQASITGAGLVLAIYTLIIPLSRSLFEHRVHTLLTYVEEFKKRAEETKTDIKDTENLKNLIDKISETQKFPTYLGLGMAIAFFGYVVSALISVGWLIEWEKPTMDAWLAPTFIVSTVIFLIVGLNSINDIHGVMKREFERIKQEVEDIKSRRYARAQFR